MKKLLSDLKHIGVKEKIAIFIILCICFGIGFVFAALRFGFSFPNNNSQLTNISISPPPKKAEIVLIAPKQRFQTGDIFDVTVRLNSPDMGVEAADFVLHFNPSYMTVSDITLGDYFQNYPIKRVTAGDIKISAVASFINNKIIIPKGDATVATIRFTTLSSAKDTSITVDSEKTIVASAGHNILGDSNSLQIVID